MRLSRALILLIPLAVSSCAEGPINITVAPHMGQVVDCVPYEPLPASAAAWLKKHKADAPPEWFQWKDGFLIGKVQPKLAKDCE